jgi:hypothetical protein
MSTKKQVTIEIDSEGNVAIEAHGYQNGECRSATEAIEDALGVVGTRTMKKGGSCTVQTDATHHRRN